MDYLFKERLMGMEGKTDPKKLWLKFFKLAHPNFEKIDLNAISPSYFYRMFGTANPSVYCNPFYSHMIKEGFSPSYFKYAYDLDYKAYCPIFTFRSRIGMSLTSLQTHGFR